MRRVLKTNPAVIGWEGGYALERAPVHCRTERQTDRQTHTFTHTFTPRGNLACPVGLTVCLWTVGGNSVPDLTNAPLPTFPEEERLLLQQKGDKLIINTLELKCSTSTYGRPHGLCQVMWGDKVLYYSQVETGLYQQHYKADQSHKDTVKMISR